MQNDNLEAKRFMQNIRNYNSAHAFAPRGTQISSPTGRGPYCFRVHGEVYHQTTQVGPADKPKYADLHLMDAAQVSEFRSKWSEVLQGPDGRITCDAKRKKIPTRQYTK
jgi:hypothetical protein